MKNVAFLLAIIWCSSVHADDIELGPHGRFSISVPEGWRMTTRKAGDVGYAAALKPAGDAHAKCLLSIAYLRQPMPIDPAKVQDTVKSTGSSMIRRSAFHPLRIESLQLTTGYGAYTLFSGADLRARPEKKDDYPSIGTGLARPTEDLMIVITVYADSADGDEMRAILRALNSIAVSKT